MCVVNVVVVVCVVVINAVIIVIITIIVLVAAIVILLYSYPMSLLCVHFCPINIVNHCVVRLAQDKPFPQLSWELKHVSVIVSVQFGS